VKESNIGYYGVGYVHQDALYRSVFNCRVKALCTCNYLQPLSSFIRALLLSHAQSKVQVTGYLAVISRLQMTLIFEAIREIQENERIRIV
jgi:hypothetical protein